MGSLTDKSAVITGAARGIGKGIAIAFAREGADLLLVTRSSSLDDAVAACKQFGVRVETVAADVSDSADAKKAIDKCVEIFGKIDILVNNAGITKDGLLLRMKDEDFESVIKTNLTGAFNCIRAVSKPMVKKRYGRIINISSVVGQIGNAGQVNYAASKAGMIGLTKSVARELASRSITVNAIAPGYIATEMTEVLNDSVKDELVQSIPMNRLGEIEDVAAGALFLASDQAGYITGHTLSINGGMAMV